jgi:probable rRNA maturation factor
MTRPKKRARTAPKKSSLPKIEVLVEDEKWRRVRGLEPLLRRAVRQALKASGKNGVRALTLLLADDERLRALNHDFRGKNKPTNVLSFEPSSARDGYLGDIAIANGVATREAEAAEKSLSDHAAHLAVHGTLHLLGYDHEESRQAEKMEALETDILRGLGIADPYAPHRGKAA